MYLGAIGPVPVFASLGLDVKLKTRAEAHATLNFRAGVRQTMDAAFGLTYNKPDVQWVNTFQFPPPEVIPFTANINAEGSFKLSLEPALEFLVYGLAGVSAGVTPSAKVVFAAGTGQPLSGRLEADVKLELKLAGPAFAPLNPKPEASLSLWHDERHLFPNTPAIAFTTQPESQTRSLGASAYFSCAVSATGTRSYQWYANGVPMAGQTSSTLLIPSVNYGHAGNYHVRVTAGGQTAESTDATLTVIPKSFHSGLIAYYPFDGNASDESGNGYDGTVYGASPGADRYGNPNKSYHFAGTTEWIKLSIDATHFTQDFSLALWVKLDDLQAQYPAIVSGDLGYIRLHAAGQIYTDGHYQKINFYQYNQPNPSRMFGHVWSANTFQWGRWYHLTVVRSGLRIQMYVDGALSDETVESGDIPLAGDYLQVGNDFSNTYGGAYFHGSLDELRIYNRALSASEIQQLYNLCLPAAPAGMALIPAGSFTMGDSLDGDSSALPLHEAYVSAFYMDKYEVTKALWHDVYNWAIAHGYNFEFGAEGKASNHPAHSMTWYDAVKWCNARSEKEGRVPAYYTSAAQSTVYRSGEVDVEGGWVNWSSGYRLPTEAEWEKAARGGARGQRFPWGNTISWSQANYGYHPTFNDGDYPSNIPYTSPVGYFAPNGYGLYDMSGNVWESCWDWYGSYSSASQTDPRGPSSVPDPYRVFRGGSWPDGANSCRSASRGCNVPSMRATVSGFRSVLPPGQ